MRTMLVSAAIATAALVSVPAAAQYNAAGAHQAGWSQARYDHGPNRRAISQLLRDIERLDRRIDRSAQRRLISPREALGLRRDLNRMENRLHRAGRNGLSGREFGQLRAQVNRIEQRLRFERRDRDGRRG